MSKTLTIGLGQFAPIWLNKSATIEKTCTIIEDAAKQDCNLLVFGEAYLPGYPFWLSFTHGSKFESELQKEIHARYIQEAVDIEAGDLDSICALAKKHSIAIYLGIIERPSDRGGHSLYCSLVYINEQGEICSVHRKLQPTYEERLSWSPGDGNGLKVHNLNGFAVGGLNCWENWMPLARTALYAQGENVHVAVWPGSLRNTVDLTRHIAKESRSFSISVSTYMTKEMIPTSFPRYKDIIDLAPDVMADGGSCISAPNGEWVIEPVVGKEQLIVGQIELTEVYKERQNFDPSGHYSRPDVTKLILNRERQGILGDD